MEFFEYLNDPIKCYFEEKASALFTRKDIVQLFSKKGPEDPKSISEQNITVSEESKENDDKFKLDNKKLLPESIQTISATGKFLDDYTRNKVNKQIDCHFMLKHDNEISKEQENIKQKIPDTLSSLEGVHDSLTDCLSQQKLNIENRIHSRRKSAFKMKSMSKISTAGTNAFHSKLFSETNFSFALGNIREGVMSAKLSAIADESLCLKGLNEEPQFSSDRKTATPNFVFPEDQSDGAFFDQVQITDHF